VKERPMARVINCECGYRVEGDSDEELLQNAHRHIDEAHPDMKGQVADEQLLAMSEEA
jgi:predicted small metal-binding protein